MKRQTPQSGRAAVIFCAVVVTSEEISDRIFRITNSAITLDKNNWII